MILLDIYANEMEIYNIQKYYDETNVRETDNDLPDLEDGVVFVGCQRGDNQKAFDYAVDAIHCFC